MVSEKPAASHDRRGCTAGHYSGFLPATSQTWADRHPAGELPWKLADQDAEDADHTANRLQPHLGSADIKMSIDLVRGQLLVITSLVCRPSSTQS